MPPLATLLSPLGRAYGAVAGLRRRLYDRGALGQRSLPCPVVSVGNLTVGGTGKTPIVAALARRYRDAGYRVGILSRGYGRRGRGLCVVADLDGVRAALDRAGDEPLLLARELPGVAVIVHPDRHLAGTFAHRQFKLDVMLLDDGFQHLRLARDLDIVVLDATLAYDRLRTLPAGPLREPVAALGRASLILVTRGHHPHDAVGLRRWIRELNAEAPILGVHQRVLDLRDPTGGKRPLADLAGRPVLALSSIGRPEQFERDLADHGARVAGRLRFRDHRRYRPRDIVRIDRAALEAGAELIVTTTKDLIRLTSVAAPRTPLVALRTELEVRDRGETWRLLRAVAGQPLVSRM